MQGSGGFGNTNKERPRSVRFIVSCFNWLRIPIPGRHRGVVVVEEGKPKYKGHIHRKAKKGHCQKKLRTDCKWAPRNPCPPLVVTLINYGCVNNLCRIIRI